ncbi:MAG: potassium transporter Kup [Rhizobiales bacterium]|nr:potassium transporter Kup [Hyphomicrobiales bacterium]OJU36215.1 MAG: potassium transporter Kup [Rhizobiales bacterium 68-8]
MDTRPGVPDEAAADGTTEHPARRPGLAPLALGAVGVVYGDIGTSPIYALREALNAIADGARPSDGQVIGVLSIIMWSLTIIVSVKYALLMLRADNRGEGGTLSLMALARRGRPGFGRAILLLGMAGASLFFGDALITPAISVLSAVEGLEVSTPAIAEFVVPITVVILVVLFSVQRFGTARVAGVFAPLMTLWLLVLAGIGLWHVVMNPAVLWALNPLEAVRFLVEHSGVALAVMGAAFLAVTGAEALYVDLGHFGRRPIMLSWFGLVFPALVLNYLGQGAYLISHDGPIGLPLFEMVAGWASLPLVILATLATVIASQAVISGTYSMTRQAIQLGLLPRLAILHTSETQSGQIYMPQMNLMLLVGVLVLVVGFGSSSDLASAYGISVTGEMVVSSLLLFFVIWGCWHRPAGLAALIVAPLLALDLVFLGANLLKIAQGGWISVAVAATVMLIALTWRRGSSILFNKTRKSEVPLSLLTERLGAKPPTVVPGTAVFLTSDPDSAPTALLHSLKHYHVLHEKNVILTVAAEDQPYVPERERVEIEPINDLFMRVKLRFGYMEQPNVPKALAICRRKGLKFDIMTTSFFLSRRSLKGSRNSGMPLWQDKLYIALARNASDATAYFQIPTGRVVEIGTQIVL